MPYPSSLNIELTTRCNLQCRYCPHDELVKTGVRIPMDIPLDFAKHVVDEYAGIQHRTLSGLRNVLSPVGLGEPLLYPHLFDVLAYIGEQFPSGSKIVQLSTNALLLDSTKAKQILESCVNRLVLSINTFDREVYRQLHGVDAYDVVKENILNFLSMKGDRLPTTIVQLMNIDINAPFLEPFVRYWEPRLNKNDTLNIRRFSDWAGAKPPKDWTQCEFAPEYPCVSIFNVIMTSVEGNVYPCCMALAHPKSDLLLGNLHEMSLRQILEGEQWEILRRKHSYNKIDMSPCKDCRTVPVVVLREP